MKLALVLLTILVSLMTERQVEANPDRVECYEFRNLTGDKFTIGGSTVDLLFKYKFRAEACRVYGAWVFFEFDFFYGKVNAFSGNGNIYFPRERFVVGSAMKVPNKSDKIALVCYEQNYYLKGDYQSPPNYFSKETKNISGQVFCKSAVVFGSSNWTVESKCKGDNCKNELTCLPAPPTGKVSFVTYTSNSGRILSVIPGKCSGKKITGRTQIPGCTCNWRGAVNDAERCNGNKGICNCLSTHTGYDCGWCKEPKVMQADGTCKDPEACGCDPRGVDSDYRCKNGKCNCRYFTRGDKCDKCADWASFRRKICQNCLCPVNKVQGGLQKCDDDTGKCNCKPQFTGDLCEGCATGHSQFRSKCLNAAQNQTVTTLYGYCKNGETSISKVVTVITEIKTTGVVDYMISWPIYEIKNGMKTPAAGACDVYNYYLD